MHHHPAWVVRLSYTITVAAASLDLVTAGAVMHAEPGVARLLGHQSVATNRHQRCRLGIGRGCEPRSWHCLPGSSHRVVKTRSVLATHAVLALYLGIFETSMLNLDKLQAAAGMSHFMSRQTQGDVGKVLRQGS